MGEAHHDTPPAGPSPIGVADGGPGFHRALGTFDAAMVVIGGIIGAGIFINPYIVAQRLDSGAWVIAAWIAGGLIALAGAFAFAELGSLIPRAGGPYVYLTRAYHPMAGFLYGWALLFMVQGGAVAAIAITFAEYTFRFLGSTASSTPLAIAAIIVVSAINALGVRPGSNTLNVFVTLKVLAIVALIVFGAFLPEPASQPAFTPSGTTLPLLAFGAALVPIMFSYGGWQSANWVAEEISEPERRLPRAIIAGTLVVILVYVAVNIVYLRALGHAGLAATTTPAADAAGRIAGANGVRMISLAIAVSTFGFLHLTVLAPTRVYWAMGADGVFFRALGRLHPRYRTPVLAISAQSGWAILLTMTGTYAQLIDYVVFADWVFFGLSAAALFALRRRIPLSDRPAHLFRTPGYPWVPALFIGAAVLVFVSVIASSPERSVVGALLLASGVPVFLWWNRRR